MQCSKFGEAMRRVQLACRFRSDVPKSIVFASPPTRAGRVMVAPSAERRRSQTLVYEFSSERGDKPPLRAQP